MTWPQPSPGLVIGYSYLWQDERRKDRPAILLNPLRHRM